MANGQFSQPSGSVATSTTAKSVVSVIAGSTAGLEVYAVKFSTDATVTSGQYLVELVRFTTDGTGTGGTPAVVGQASAASATFTTKVNYTVEPTTATVLDAFFIPALGYDAEYLPLGQRFYIPKTQLVTVRVTAPSGTPNVRATLYVED